MPSHTTGLLGTEFPSRLKIVFVGEYKPLSMTHLVNISVPQEFGLQGNWDNLPVQRL